MKDSTKKIIITILNIGIMVANAIIAYFSGDSGVSAISTVGLLTVATLAVC